MIINISISFSDTSHNKIIDNLNYSDESIDYDSVDDYDIIILTELNYTQQVGQITHSLNVNQLDNHRRKVKKYYEKKNERVVKGLNLDEYNYTVSYYSPYIEILFDDLSEFEDSKDGLMEILQFSEEVERAVINYIEYDETTTSSETTEDNYPFSDALADIGVTDLAYTGNGVNVGTIELGAPDSTENLKTDKFTSLSSYTTNHSTRVTSIIGGISGIAEDVHLYCAGLLYSSFTDCVNKLIDNYKVNVINISYGCNHLGFYDCYCAYIDWIIRESGCTIVKSAGNDGGTASPNFSSPGCAMNAITVGATDSSKNVSTFSSWYTSNNYLYKPDLVAPGENISSIRNLPGTNSGTSFSAPMVTGMIALLMEEFSYLKYNPSLVKAALQNGCVQLPFQTSYFAQKTGFGLVNYQNTRNYLINSQYNTFSIPTSASAGDIITSYNLTIPMSTKIEINANWIINSVNVGVSNNTYDSSYTTCYIKIYDLHSSTYVASSSTDSNILFLSFINGGDSDKYYRIDVVVKGEKALGGIEIGSFVYSMHSHTHDYNCVPVNSTYHVSRCNCGRTGAQYQHVIDGSSPGNMRYRPCIFCGYAVDTGGGGIFPIIKGSKIVYATFSNGVPTYYSSIEEYCVTNGLVIMDNLEQLNNLLTKQSDK